MTRVHGIVPQLQPTDRTCVHTCLAMVLDVPVQQVIDRYGEEPMSEQRLYAALTEHGVLFDRMTFGDRFLFSGWYLAGVPSLNVEGGTHEILIHWSRREGMTVLDPSPLRAYHRDGLNLATWFDLTPVKPIRLVTLPPR